jgi:hypothetical protein
MSFRIVWSESFTANTIGYNVSMRYGTRDDESSVFIGGVGMTNDDVFHNRVKHVEGHWVIHCFTQTWGLFRIPGRFPVWE